MDSEGSLPMQSPMLRSRARDGLSRKFPVQVERPGARAGASLSVHVVGRHWIHHTGSFFWKALLLIRIIQNGRRPAPYGLTESGPIFHTGSRATPLSSGRRRVMACYSAATPTNHDFRASKKAGTGTGRGNLNLPSHWRP